MAGTVVVTEERDPHSISKITFDFTTSSSTGRQTLRRTKRIRAKSCWLKLSPALPATTPTAAFDVAVTDGDGVDVLLGYGTDMSNSSTTIIKEDYLGACAGDLLTLAVTNAGNSKTGKVILYIR